MVENKQKKEPEARGNNTGQHGKKADERRLRQAESLRANLKKRKQQMRQRGNPGENDA